MTPFDTQQLAAELEALLELRPSDAICQIREVELEGCLSALGGCAFAMLTDA